MALRTAIPTCTESMLPKVVVGWTLRRTGCGADHRDIHGRSAQTRQRMGLVGVKRDRRARLLAGEQIHSDADMNM